MITIHDYTIDHKLHQGIYSTVYRGHRKSDNLPVVLKILKKENPLPIEIARFRREYEITRAVNSDGTIKVLDLTRSGSTLAIVLEDFGGESLFHHLHSGEIDLELPDILSLAIDITDALGQIHQQNLMHKDITVHNIVWNPDTGQVKIIDFGISTQLPRETPSISTINVLEGTLAYMSPEQTGRMNRSMDYRTDLYSLGITLYEMVTGHPPFTTKDPMELVHSHIARLPVPPDEVNPEIPKPVSEIIMKLTSKMAEERYQSAFGLKHDLVQCLKLILANEPENILLANTSGNLLVINKSGNPGKIQEFVIGQNDISDRLRIPQKLYGREAEIETLITGFEEVRQGGCKLVLVTGHAGIGKTALVHEVQRPLIEKNTASSKTEKRYFISGKFDQLKKNVPYAPLIQAFKQLIHHLLAETDEQVAEWKEKLMKALGPNGQVIVDVIPDVELIIGKQPEVPALGPMENFNRFNYVFENFITTFASEEHPLVVFLDDLQWADSASLKLIEMFLTVNAQYLYLIGAYRDNEVDVVHPLMMTIDEIRKSGAIVEHLNLQPLNQYHVNQLISETFSCKHDRSDELAALCHSKTRGNPFFLSQFIHSLYRECLIEFNGNLGIWEWNEAKIRQTDITDNVIELMTSKIRRLSKNTGRIVSFAACIGNRFDLDTLSIVYGKSAADTSKDLAEALQEELIVPVDNAYKYVAEFLQSSGLTYDSEDNKIIPVYRFLHDRVQQAAYSLIEEQQRAAIHLKIGKELLKRTPENELEERVFLIVDQLNLSPDLITDEAERERLAELNLLAGKKAKLSAAYNPASDYLKSGMNVLKKDCWQSQYHLTLSIYEEAVEAAYLCSDFKVMEHLADTVLYYAKTVIDKIKVYDAKIQACFAQHNLLDAVNIGLDVLKLLGINWPDKPNKLDVLSAYMRTKIALAGKRHDDLLNLKKMTDPYKIAILDIVESISSSVYFAAPKLVPLFVFKCVKLSCEYGNTPNSIFFYNSYGFVLSGVIGNIDKGNQFGILALNLLKKLNAKLCEVRAVWMYNVFLKHWKEHIRSTLTSFEVGFQRGLEIGDFDNALCCAYSYTFYSYYAGIELNKIHTKALNFNKIIKKLKNQTWLYLNECRWQVILNLMGYGQNNTQIIGDIFDEEKVLTIYKKQNDKTGLCSLYLNKFTLCYLFYEYDNAVANIEITKQYLDAQVSLITIPIFHFYDSLAHLAVFPNSPKTKQISILFRVFKNQRKVKKWAYHAPMNHLHKWHLVEAERARVIGRYHKAIDLYDKAIAGANKNEYIQEEALAYELAAKFYLENDKMFLARTYMIEARERYFRWGAMAKVKHLDETYPELLKKPEQEAKTEVAEPQTTTKTEPTKESKAAGTIESDQTIQDNATIQPTQTVDSNFTIQTTTIHRNSKTGKYSQKLDLDTIIKSSQTISGEIRFDRLLEKMMEIVVENAGAQKAILLLEKNGRWFIESEGGIGKKKIKPMSSIPLDVIPLNPVSLDSIPLDSIPLDSIDDDSAQNPENPLLPQTIVHYVIRTQSPLILNNVAKEQQFSTDPYIVRNRPKSILCLPILHQRKMIGIGYLENNLTHGAFTTERLEVLRLLSSQIAISIQNARLYANLEELVDERTRELTATLDNLKDTQDQLVESEKMAALGQLIAGIAHEINTPLGVIRASAGNMLDAFNEAIPQLTELFETLSPEKLQIFFDLVRKAIEKRLPLSAREERKLRKELCGRLEEQDIEDADEIADTLVDMGIYDDSIISASSPFLTLFKEDKALFLVQLAYNLSGQQRNSNNILTAVDRASKTVFALKNYAHYDRSGTKIKANIMEGIETVLTLYHNQLKQGVEVTVTGFEDIPPIACYPDELNQVWTNLVHNALQAMNHKGRLQIKAEHTDTHVIVSFTDSGCGIPEENIERIFDPFFTTKSRGEGSGMGLDICKRIVEKHHGTITVQSRVGETQFRVELAKQ